MIVIKYEAKETFYNGITFRSRNEAKWARFFDVAGLAYNYEPVMFSGWNNARYKPDFYFPKYEKYAEVKSSRDGIHNEYMAAKINGCIDYQSTPVSNGLLLLGAFPFDVRVQSVRLQTKWLFWHKGVCCADANIRENILDGRIELDFTFNNIDTGDPLPISASPDIFVVPSAVSLKKICQAIKQTNDYFNTDQDESLETWRRLEQRRLNESYDDDVPF